jgi:hypothetical protein
MYKLQVTFSHTDHPWWITVHASSDSEARSKAYEQNPRYQILCCKEWDGEEGSYYN